jgi:hypothetical protein
MIALLRAAFPIGIHIVSHQIPSHWNCFAILMKKSYRHPFTCPGGQAPAPVPSDQTWEMAINGWGGSITDVPASTHAVGFPASTAFSNIRVSNRFVLHGLVVQDSWRCATAVKSSRECSQKSNVHWSWPLWPPVCSTFAVAGICKTWSRFSAPRLLAAAHTRFRQRLNLAVTVSIALTIEADGRSWAMTTVDGSSYGTSKILRRRVKSGSWDSVDLFNSRLSV